jgi:sugar phosphate isomerase/epimerase
VRIAVQEHLLPGATLREKWEFAASVGFEGIELRGEEGFRDRLEELRAAVAAGAVVSSVCVISTTTFIGSFDDGRRRQAVAQLRDLIDVAGELGARGVVTPAAYGQFSRNLPPFTPPRSDDEDRAVLHAALSELGERAERAGTLVYLEPLNRYEDHVWNRIEQAVALLSPARLPRREGHGRPLPHEHRGARPVGCHPRRRRLPRPRPPGRLPPLRAGGGHIDFASRFAALRDIGFEGWMALECRLSGEADDVLPRVGPGTCARCAEAPSRTVHDVLDIRDLLRDELDQQAESGHDVEAYRDPVAAALRDGAEPTRLEELLEAVVAAPRRADWPYVEPDDAATLGAPADEAGATVAAWTGDDASLGDRLHGAWLGRCVGCTLGKPFEAVGRADIARYLAAAEVEELDDYVPLLHPVPDGIELHASWPETVRGRIDGAARDDDTDYTILGLHLLERHGAGFTRADVATGWLGRFPFLQVYTAERAAYRNLVRGHGPDVAARIRNPYREWIGAQIRADPWGYAAPGDLRSATRMAWEDAGLSHVGNGVYGAVWAPPSSRPPSRRRTRRRRSRPPRASCRHVRV